jgi:hypothetical protein
MKTIHIVNPYDSAAMIRMTEPLKATFPNLYNVTTSDAVDHEADINIHFPFHSLIGMEKQGNGKHVAVYTHTNVGMEEMVADACNRADIVTAMSFTGRDELLNLGVDPKKIHVIYCAADDFKFRKRLIGIIGYPQPNGRKREGMLLDLAWQYDLTPFEFILTGAGWEGMTERLHSLGVSCSWHHADTFDKLQTVLRFLDVLVVTGYREGGPLPLLECMSSGVPVLSPKFGYASDLLDNEYLYETPEDLYYKLESMFAQTVYHHQLIRAWTWQDYAAEYAILCGRLLGESVDLYPERGMSRYTQLLDIIDRERPASICEIGTWNGNNGIRMIQQAQKYNEFVTYQGFDLFEGQTLRQYKSELSKRGQPFDVVKKRMDATGADVELVEGDTNYTIHELLPADLYFVDGGHSERTIENDGRAVLANLTGKSVAVFDDYYTAGKPEGMGCNKFIDNLPTGFVANKLPVVTNTSDGRQIIFVEVRRADVSVQMQGEPYHYTYTPDLGV